MYQCFLLFLCFFVFCASELKVFVLFYVVNLCSYYSVFVFINCIYSTVKFVKFCIYICYVPIKASYLLTYLLTYYYYYYYYYYYELHWTDEAESRHRLRSGSCPRLIVPRTRLSTIGDRSFRVTVARAWNSIPTSITALTSLSSFKRQLRTFLFTKFFPSV